jgi:hypothetical protein
LRHERRRIAICPTRDESAVNRIIRDPVEGAYLLAVRKLGEHLYELGGADLMTDVCGDVVARDGPRSWTTAGTASAAS